MPDSQTSTNCSSASRAASGPWAIAIGVAAAAQLGLQVLAEGAATTDAHLRRELNT